MGKGSPIHDYFRAPLKSRQGLLLSLLVLAFVGIAIVLKHRETIASNPLDFRAFYCAGAALLDGADPYRAEPLRSCESAALKMAGLTGIPYLAIPAPLPGYVFPIFMLAARIDFISASTLFALASVAAVGITVIAIWRLTSLPIITIFTALVVADGYVGLINGQIVPIFIMFLCLAALACRRDRPWLAALCCASATIEPHLALPACVSLAVFVPRARVPLAVFAVVLTAASIATLGIARNIEYVTQVLPAHVASEATNAGQYSLTSLLFHIGVPVDAAIRAGEASYVVMILLGLAATARLRRKRGGSAFIVLMPVAFALLGGSYIHVVQIAAAIPAGLVLVAYYPLQRPTLVAGLSLLSIPWLAMVRTSGATPIGVIVAAAFVSVAVVWPLLRGRATALAITLATALLIFATGLFALWVPATSGTHVLAPALLRVAGANELAETTWTVYERLTQSQQFLQNLIVKLPTWIGLMIIITASWRVAARGPIVAMKTRTNAPNEATAAESA